MYRLIARTSWRRFVAETHDSRRRGRSLAVRGRVRDLANPVGSVAVRQLTDWKVLPPKRQVLADIIAALQRAPGLDPEHVMVCFKETQWENWSFAGGRILHA